MEIRVLRSNGQRATIGGPFAAVFPVNMGNRGQNVLNVPDTYRALQVHSGAVRFVAYHPRISGNFIFVVETADAVAEASKIGQAVTGLPCLARRFEELQDLDISVPKHAFTVRRSVLVDTPRGRQRVIAVFLSHPVPPSLRITGLIGPRVESISWPSERDVLCLYDRPGEAGDVGQVTRKMVGVLKQRGASKDLIGTGRALSVVRDLVTGEGLWCD